MGHFFGLPFKMEAMVRFFPETDLGDDGGKAKMLGLGLKKEITSWFGPLKKLPLYASEDLKKVNFLQSLLTSLNYLIWGDV